MNRYEGLKCPICNTRLFDDDDIAVCPICGAPHHRDCYLSRGHCAYESTHGTSRQWSRPEPAPEPETPNGGPGTGTRSQSGPRQGDFVGHTCPRCNRRSTSDTLFCPYCGFPLGNMPKQPPQQGGPGPGFPFGTGPMGGGPMWAPVVPLDPLGGVDPSESIDGIPVSDAAAFVATSTRHYIPRFVAFSKNKAKASWNWVAFLFSGYWLMARKCYRAGTVCIAMNVLRIVLLLPAMRICNDILMSLPTDATYDAMVQALIAHQSKFAGMPTILAICSLVVGLGTAVVCGIFGDYLYKNHMVTMVSQLKGNQDVNDYHMALLARGGINLLAPILVYLLFRIVNMFTGAV